MKPRGVALLVVAAVLAALGAVAASVWVRLSADTYRRVADQRRVQLLWLARSAVPLLASDRGIRVDGATVRLSTRASDEPGGRRVRVSATRAGTGVARIDVLRARDGRVLEWRERFERAAPR